MRLALKTKQARSRSETRPRRRCSSRLRKRPLTLAVSGGTSPQESRWSAELYRILGIDLSVSASFELFMQHVHTEEDAARQAVDRDLRTRSASEFGAPRRLHRRPGAVAAVAFYAVDSDRPSCRPGAANLRERPRSARVAGHRDDPFAAASRRQWGDRRNPRRRGGSPAWPRSRRDHRPGHTAVSRGFVRRVPSPGRWTHKQCCERAQSRGWMLESGLSGQMTGARMNDVVKMSAPWSRGKAGSRTP